ncbi:hypothetical protein [Trichococcus flocculiformis]|uniref:hypothetical protein n=1 Tax=Trichococcus flocculiformis TaxID=82803 RepID=UPI003DA62876
MATPKILLYEVELRAVRLKRNLSRPVVYTNDLNSAEFQFKVIDMDAGDLSTATATTLLYMRDGSFFQNPKEDVGLVGTTFSYTLKENEGNHAGIAKIQLIVTIGEAEYATQLYEFEIINGLETKVAQEVMIYDWTTLTRDARAYIDQFVADEVFRDAQFDNAQFDRNVAFVSSQESRDLAFGVEQTDRGAAFTTEQTDRNTAFNNAQDARALTFSESESGRTTAENGRVTAEDDRVEAETDRVTEEGKRVTAESGRVTEEGKRVTAESGRVTAESGRVTTFAGYNARITGMESDVNVNGTNLVTNGDFSNGTADWLIGDGVTKTVVNNEVTITSLATSTSEVFRNIANLVVGNKYYSSVEMSSGSYGTECTWLVDTGGVAKTTDRIFHSGSNVYQRLSGITLATNAIMTFRILDSSRSGDISASPIKLRRVILIDLTATFGKGNEPTAEQMDGIMGKFTNSWFDGTKNLFRANAALNKLMAVDARTEFDAKNEVVNGDFSNGTTGWTASNGTISAANNTVANTGDGSYISSRVQQIKPIENGKKYYAIAKVRVTNANCTSLKLDFNNGSVLQMFSSFANPVNGTWYTLSGLITATNTSNLSDVRVSHLYADAATANGKVMEVQYAALINLTATFGAGKEPTLAEMDRLMARFPNRWFDGVKPMQTIETLYQEKANKAQEAWITPTLLNGWVHGTNPIKYRKDSVGNVHIEGSVKNGGGTFTQIFMLPVGYRPLDTKYFPILSSYSSGAAYVDASGGVNFANGTLTSENRLAITFSVD